MITAEHIGAANAVKDILDMDYDTFKANTEDFHGE